MPQLAWAKAAAADVVFAAFGTNDLGGREVSDVVECARAFVDAAKPIPVILALVPPTFPLDPGCTGCRSYADRNAKIAALNAQLLRTFGRRDTVDFHTRFRREHFASDEVHLNATGHALRARIAVAKLRARLRRAARRQAR